MIEALALAGIPTIPVRVWQDGEKWRKEPSLVKWDQATTDPETLEEWSRQWPDALPGVPLARVGWAVIDLDDYGDAAFHEAWVKPERMVTRKNRSFVEPEHYSIYKTPSGGRHIVFAQPDPPLTGRMEWSAGVEILGIGTLLTVYDWAALLYPRVAQRAVLPEVFRQPWDGGLKRTPLGKSPPLRDAAGTGEVVGAGRSSTSNEPRRLARGGTCGYKNWFALVGACKAVGIGREEFVEWCLGDERYAAHRKRIERIWESAWGTHGGALFKALAERGIKLPSNTRADTRAANGAFSSGGPLKAKATPTINLRSRTDGLASWLAASPTDDRLFTVAATFGEIILEQRIQRRAANQLLESACQANGLWKLLGPDRCRRTIARGFRHVEEKFLGERE
jgi:hypothetical protein